MELHPILDQTTSPNPALWYVVSALGECPTQRVGHTATFIPGEEGRSGKVYIVGGANPNGPFSETYILDLDTLSWDTLDAPGLKARYEHAAFSPASSPSKIFIFGGADQGGNHNDIQVLETATILDGETGLNAAASTAGGCKWATVSASGAPPSPRTYHVAACVGDKFVVYSGGQSGPDPVGDRQVHIFNAVSASWEVMSVKGDPPKPRHGHLVVGSGTEEKVYIHGGMSGNTFYDDLHVLDLKAGSWKSVKQKRGHPSARAAHSGALCGNSLYLFGGMSRDGALDDFHKLDTATLKWTSLALEGPPPACRLDYAMCLVRIRVPAQTIERTEDINATRVNAREVLDSQLRLGSAGSVRSLGSVGSLGSAGSMRSAASSAGSNRSDPVVIQEVSTEPLVVSGSQLSQQSADSAAPGAAVAAVTAATDSDQPEGGATSAIADESIEYRTVDMCLIFGGMDTEGEIFDDCLVYLIDS